MNHRILCFTILILLYNLVCFADDDCDEALSDGKGYYNSGQYDKAKEQFDWVMKICGPSYGGASQWSDRCVQAKKYATTTKNSSGTQSSSAYSSQTRSGNSKGKPTKQYVKPYMNVFGNTSPSFSLDGGSSNITISCNKDWGFTYLYKDYTHKSLSYDFKVEREGNTLTISCGSNPYSYMRNAQFDIFVRENKTIKQTIYISQAASQSFYIYASSDETEFASSGGVHTITVSANTGWRIADKSNWLGWRNKTNTSVEVYCYKNATSSELSGYVTLTTTSGNQSKTIYYKQSKTWQPVTNTPTYRASLLEDYFQCNGEYSVKWANVSLALGYPSNFDFSLIDFRIFWFDFSLANFGVQSNYSNSNWYWQPNIGISFPIDCSGAIRISAGPKYNFRKASLEGYYRDYYPYCDLTDLGYYDSDRFGLNKKWWFTAQIGYVFEWEDYFSSEFFIRYNGCFAIGASINVHTDF